MHFSRNWILCLLYLPCLVLANTEIVNFGRLDAGEVELPSHLMKDWPVLSPQRNEDQWTLKPAPGSSTWDTLCNNAQETSTKTPKLNCSHELWVILDTAAESWQKYSKFTLRLSWPATYSTDFKLDIYSPADVAAHFHLPSPSSSSSQMTKTQYGRIRIIDTSILTPPLPYNLPMPPFVAHQDPSNFPKPVPFILILEPLYFGVLPPTVVPVLEYIALILAVSYVATPRIIKYLDELATQARAEFSAAAAKEKKLE